MIGLVITLIISTQKLMTNFGRLFRKLTEMVPNSSPLNQFPLNFPFPFGFTIIAKGLLLLNHSIGIVVFTRVTFIANQYQYYRSIVPIHCTGRYHRKAKEQTIHDREKISGSAVHLRFHPVCKHNFQRFRLG